MNGFINSTKSGKNQLGAYLTLESTPIIRGINSTELADLILKYNEHLNEKYRKMIPLKMVYIPISRGSE